VYLPNKLVVTGTLQHYNLEYNVAVISVMGFRCLRTAEFHNQVQIEPQREVVAVGRVFESGKLMATSGIVTGKEGKLDCKELMVTTCKITKAGIGGPLIDLDGNFLGMNFYGMKETYFLPRNIILGLMKHFEAERWLMSS
jgi:S1-C subfamily serine protease